MGDWKILLPTESTNMALNPVGMGTGNYAAITTATVTVDSASTDATTYLGYLHYKASGTADDSGISFTLGALSNAIHYATLRTYGAVVAWDWSLDNSNFAEPTLLRQEGSWYVYGHEFPAAQANASTTLYVQKKAAGDYTWYIGHVQVESGSVETTPITGDRKGFCSDGYYWNGTAHASTSTRAGKERSGGVETDLETAYNFKVMYSPGSGMPPLTHHTQGMALLPGALYQGHHVEPRVLDLYSVAKASTAANVMTARKNFINAIKPDRVSPEQPVVFRSYVTSTKPVDFYAVYDSGMEFATTSGVSDKPTARFICYDPFAYEVHTQSAVLTTSLSVADADYIARKINGTWYNINTGFDQGSFAIVKGLDGCIYIGGAFTTTGLADHDHYIVKWDPVTNTRSALGTGMNGNVNALAVAPNGDIYAGGAFTSAGGVANTARIAYWDISAAAWKPLSTGIGDGLVGALAFGHDGTLYIGGTFTNMGGATGDAICKWNGTAFSVMGNGFNALVAELTIAPNGDVYATGNFTYDGTGAGTAFNYIAKWNGTAWSTLGTGLSTIGQTIATDKAGNIVVGGQFTTADSVACNYIAKWNGKTFEPLGTGLSDQCAVIKFDNNGILYAGGSFGYAGGLSVADGLAIYNGTTWANIDCDLPGTASTTALLPDNNNFYVSYNTSGAATTSYLNSVTNSGTTIAYPIIKIHRAEDGTYAQVSWLKNETTGDILWLNYSLLQGETLIIDLTPGNRSIKSDMFGEVWRALLRSSDLSSFGLLPGINNISEFTFSDATITAWLEWPLTHWGADGVAA